jgi:hypothetical protein
MERRNVGMCQMFSDEPSYGQGERLVLQNDYGYRMEVEFGFPYRQEGDTVLRPHVMITVYDMRADEWDESAPTTISFPLQSDVRKFLSELNLMEHRAFQELNPDLKPRSLSPEAAVEKMVAEDNAPTGPEEVNG